MEQLVPWLTFCVAFLLFALVKPGAARVFIGIFFIIMALAVNATLSILAPELFVAIGTDAPLVPWYAWFFDNIVAVAPPLVGVVAAAGEVAVGLLILSRGCLVRLGLIAGIVFLLAIAPLGVWTLPNPVMAAGLARLLAKDFPYALWDRHARRSATGLPVQPQ